jgi:hypothetical protein
MIIGKLVKSNTHTDYVCQIYGPGEVESPPTPGDYAFGTFVRVPLYAASTDAAYLVGVIYDTVLVNPDFGNLGPRLSPAPDLEVFSPDYLAEKVTLVGITTIGMVSAEGHITHGVPTLTAQIDALVSRLEDDDVRAFHHRTEGVQVGYAPLLMTLGSPLARPLLLRIVERLRELFPQQSACLSVLRAELAWQAFVGPLGSGV